MPPFQNVFTDGFFVIDLSVDVYDAPLARVAEVPEDWLTLPKRKAKKKGGGKKC